MKTKNILYLAIGLIAITILLIWGCIAMMANGAESATPLSLYTQENISNNNILPTQNGTNLPEENVEGEQPVETPTTSPSSPPTQSINNNLIDKKLGEITIRTNKKDKTYEIMRGVDKNTLKKNIGWLPSSSLPNQDGVCVLMGHRDTDFKILKYTEIGDIFSISIDGATYNYSVVKTEIITSEDNIQFYATNKPCLMLVTCYPFYYTGSAPQKYVVSLVR